jgi:NMD protein affecting ribosome stability and mRNA decay
MRIDKNIKQKVHDPYYDKGKLPNGTFCPECHATFMQGKWLWPKNKSNQNGEEHLCPACRRIRDNFPAGELHATGSYFMAHEREIRNLINRVLREEDKRSPLKRLMRMGNETSGIWLQLTDDHLTRRIGEALHSAYKGQLDLQYIGEDRFVRLSWHRD